MVTAEEIPPPKGTMLLQALRRWAVTSHKCAYPRGIIDGRSQQTVIRKDIADKLNLPVQGSSVITLNIFGDSAGSAPRQRCDIVEFRLRSQFDTMEHTITAATVPFISRGICTTRIDLELAQNIRSGGGHIAHELLFPHVEEEAGIGLLLGCDQHWKITTARTQCSEATDKLVRIHASIGWAFEGLTTVCGPLTHDANALICVFRTGATFVDDIFRSHLWELDRIGIVDHTLGNEEEGKSDE